METGEKIETNQNPIKIINMVNWVSSENKMIPSVLIEQQFDGTTARDIVPIKKFYSSKSLRSAIGLNNDHYKNEKVDSHIRELSLDKTIITVVDKYGYCFINGEMTFIHSEGTITNMFSPSHPLTSSNLTTPYGHYNPLPLTAEDNPQELVTRFLQILNISPAKPEVGIFLMAKITNDALLHFKKSNVSLFYVNQGGKHKPFISKLARITSDRYILKPFAIEICSSSKNEPEDITENYSLSCDVNSADIDRNVFSNDFILTSNDCFSKVMHLFIQYIVNNYDLVNSKVESMFKKHKKMARKSLGKRGHKSSPLIVSDLMLGIYIFLKFCFDEKYLKGKQAKIIRNTTLDHLIEFMQSQEK